jgi:hypothetical protein
VVKEYGVVIDPCINPDGRDRYVNWFNSVVGKQLIRNLFPASIQSHGPADDRIIIILILTATGPGNRK